MRAIIADVPEFILDWRRRTGADRWDEMWEGVLHMPPSPNREHQDFEGALEMWLRIFWAKPLGNRVYHQINVAASAANWRDNYRIPDLVLLTPDRFSIDHNEFFIGGPDVVVEIRSPDDETYEKLPFYAQVGVREVWVIDRDSRQIEIYALANNAYQRKPPEENGWLFSKATGIELRTAEKQRLAIRMRGDDSTLEELPD